MARLSISLLGPLEVLLDDQPVTQLVTGKARALLAYLAVEADRARGACRRETLAGLLWPDYPERSARTNLRNSLSNLRKAIGDRDADLPCLLVTRETIQFNVASDCTVDAIAFGELASATDATASQLEEAIALYSGPFLEGFSVDDSPAFEDWVFQVRERMERQVLETLDALAEHYEERGEYGRALEHARRRVALAPWQEQAHQDLMRLLAMDGQRSAALAQYETCRRALRQELDVEPGKETTRLYARIRDGQLTPPEEEEKASAILPARETEAPPDSPEVLPGAEQTALPPQPPLPSAARQHPAPVEGQRRVVTALIADVKGSTALAEQVDVETWVEIMNEVLQILSAEVYRFGGEVDQFRGDGLVAFFGVPTVHEDDPERAVLAALAMQEEFRRHAAEMIEREGIELLLRVGVNTGEVVTATVGDRRQHSEQTAMGRAIALAARMESAAQPGTVLVTESTYRLLGSLFDWQPLDEIQVKGVSDPVPVYRPLAHKPGASKPRGIPGLESPLVGRGSELGALEATIDRLRAGIGGVVTVVGEAGIGKSRLVTEVRDRVGAVCQRYLLRPKGQAQVHSSGGEQPLQWIEGRCLSYATNVAYQLWLDMFRCWLAVAPDAPPDAVRDALKTLVQDLCPEDVGDVYPFLGRMMSLPLGDAAEAKLGGLGAEGLKASTFCAVETLVESAARQGPLVVVCEDLHWADPTSIELLGRLLSLVDRTLLLFICIFRPQTTHDCWQIKETAMRLYHHCHTDLQLRPLTPAESAALVGNLLPLGFASRHSPTASPERSVGRDTPCARRVEDLSEELRARILAHAEGNPFYVEEILRSLIEAGTLVHDETTGRWHATQDVSGIPIPDTLRGVLNARIDRLSGEAKRVLLLASVIGRIFTYSVLTAIADGASRTMQGGERPGGRARDVVLDTHLITLQRAQLIRERERVPETVYIFKHQLTQEAAYSSLLRRERRTYHRRVAEAMERLYPDRAQEQVELLAHHWEQADEPGKAIHYLLQAGERAACLGASLEAVGFYQAALKTATGLGAKGDVALLRRIHECLGDIYCETLSRHEEALEHYTTFLASTETVEDRARGERKVGAVHLIGGDLHQARACFDRALDQLRSLPPCAEKSRVHFGLAYLFISSNQLEQAAGHADQSLNISRQAGDTRGLADAYRTKGIVASRRGESEAGREFHERSLELYRELGDLMRITQACNNLGNSYRLGGQMDRALERLEEGIEIARRTGNTRDEALLLGTLAEVFLDQGKWKEAIAHLEQALPLAEASGAAARMIHVHRVLGMAYEGVGCLEDARRHLETAQRISQETQYSRYTPRIYLGLAHLSATEGAFDQAQQHIEAALHVAGPAPSDLFHSLMCCCQGYLSARRGHYDDAVDRLGKGLVFLEQANLPVEEAKTRLMLGSALANRGREDDRGRACEQLLAALSVFGRIGAPGYMAQANAQLEGLGCQSSDPRTVEQQSS